MLAPEFGEHVRVGLDRRDLGTEADQGRGQLAGSRPQVEDPERLAPAGRLQGPADGGLGVAGPVLGVGGRGGAERRPVPQPFLAFGLGQVIHAIRPGAWRRRRPERR